MDLTSDHPFWFVKNGLLRTYPPLERDMRCEVAVLGAGITGAILADRLVREGHDVVIVDGRDLCLGSTSASTALLQYEIDVPLIDLREKIGHAAANRAYRLSHESIDVLTELALSLDGNVGFERKTSIYLAREEKSAAWLREEAAARREIGLDADLLEGEAISERFHIAGLAAIATRQAASVDPYRLAHALFQRSVAAGARLFDRTQVDEIVTTDDGVKLRTDRGPTIRAKKLIIATGYEAQTLLKEKVVQLKSTYALVSQPLDDLSPWDPKWLLWEAKEPYLYLRATDDWRLLVGGEDDDFQSPSRRDASLPKKVEAIKRKVRDLLPSLAWEVEFAWAGTFGETQDGLAYIGESPERPHCLFALGFGGNGITFSTIAAGLIADAVAGRENANADLFRFGR